MSDKLRIGLLHILQHTIGLDQYGQGRQYRNHFVAGDDDVILCRELVALGLMVERESNGLTGGSPWFSVTPKGIDAVALQSPVRTEPPKLTRSQRRYQEYLDIGDCFDSFRDFLLYSSNKEKEARHG